MGKKQGDGGNARYGSADKLMPLHTMRLSCPAEQARTSESLSVLTLQSHFHLHEHSKAPPLLFPTPQHMRTGACVTREALATREALRTRCYSSRVHNAASGRQRCVKASRSTGRADCLSPLCSGGFNPKRTACSTHAAVGPEPEPSEAQRPANATPAPTGFDCPAFAQFEPALRTGLSADQLTCFLGMS
eukprot:5805310-Pleurochrysis_carterae.AAC.1